MQKSNVQNLPASSSNYSGRHRSKALHNIKCRAVTQSPKGCGWGEYTVRLESALINVVVSLFLFVSMVNAAEFIDHEGKDMLGMDISPGIDTLNIGTEHDEQNFCRRHCDLDPHCMAFTWVRRNVQGPSAKCWFKASSRIFENNGEGLLTINPDTFTGVKIYRGTACWARHIFNLKFCNVFFAGALGDPITPVTLECPPDSKQASISNRTIPGRFDGFCVVGGAHDPGGLPNCTDAFGGEAHDAGVLGNSVNHACLDTN